MSEQNILKKLTGTWYNQLGSRMTLTATAEEGGLTGTYHSAVGKAPKTYILAGRFDASPNVSVGEGISLGWVVTYLEAHSTATWSGQYFADGDERILTHWLLTTSTIPGEVWKSTNVGTDTFTRNPPNAAEIAKARALTFGLPHPEDIIAATLREGAPLKSRL